MAPKPKPADNPARVERRLLLLDVAERLFREKGYASTTTNDLAAAAAMSKRDLYALFDGKDALLRALVSRTTDRMVAPVTAAEPADREQFFAALAAMGEAFLSELLSPNVVSIYRTAIAGAPTAPELGRTLMANGGDRSKAAVRTYIEAAQARGLVRFADIEAALGIYFFLLIGDLQMTALLNPRAKVAPSEMKRRAALAVGVLARMDGAALRPK